MRKFWQKRYISKYTGKEIDDAVAKAGTALQNPMTAAGDLIVGGEDGAAEKLTKGADGKVLKMVSGAPAWADDSAGMANPMTAAGDLIVGGADGAASRLGKGTDGQVLSMVSGAPAWAAAGGGGGSLYQHNIIFSTGSNGNGTCIVINNSATAFDTNSFKTYLTTNFAVDVNHSLPCNGYFKDSTTVDIYNGLCVLTNKFYILHLIRPSDGTETTFKLLASNQEPVVAGDQVIQIS